MAPRSYDDSEDPLMGRLVEIATGEGRWRPGVIAFCETTLDGSKGAAEVSTGRYRVAWGRFESKTQFLDVVAKKNTLKVRVFRLGYDVRSATPRERRPRRPAADDGSRQVDSPRSFAKDLSRITTIRRIALRLGDSRLSLTPTRRIP